ncbi:MAG: hypothetical protein CVU80_00355 [Elusimicrobia bacterium HGW-Elusimicrobia-4]|nr:MAG: hypothetical protein CVU80_00355 [Elusimicrobia bacterium HGW-Elusimicrobia-4]
MKANTAIKKSCQRLELFLRQNKFCSDGIIDERDVQCLLYHFCVDYFKSPEKIHAEYNLPKSRRRVDLYLKSRRGGLAIEIKLFNYGMTRGLKRWKEKEKVFFTDIHKMGKLNAKHKRKSWFILFIKSIGDEVEKNEVFLKKVKRECKRCNVIFRQIPQIINEETKRMKLYS